MKLLTLGWKITHNKQDVNFIDKFFHKINKEECFNIQYQEK